MRDVNSLTFFNDAVEKSKKSELTNQVKAPLLIVFHRVTRRWQSVPPIFDRRRVSESLQGIR